MSYIYQKRAKLVGNVDCGILWLLNVHDDWIHDQYGESYIYHGVVYSNSKAFHKLSTTVTGYFQDDETGQWIKVQNGRAIFDPNDIRQVWKKQLDDFISLTFKTGVYKKYKIMSS
jgi:hypothetical protein